MFYTTLLEELYLSLSLEQLHERGSHAVTQVKV